MRDQLVVSMRVVGHRTLQEQHAICHTRRPTVSWYIQHYSGSRGFEPQSRSTLAILESTTFSMLAWVL